MIRKSMPSGFDPMGGCRFSEKIMLHLSMIRRSGYRFYEKIMLYQRARAPR
jgi:hypothetical protein